MRSLFYVTLSLAVMALGFWAYRENYRTQESLREVRALRVGIGAAQARLDRLAAEWAYLNRPDRLRDLADLNFERLALMPLPPEAFAPIDAVAFPPTTLGPITGAVAVSSDGAWEEPL